MFAEGELSLIQAITWQLRSNHYPAVPESMVAPCLEAVLKCSFGENDSLIPLPDGITWKGQSEAPAEEIVDGHHLWPFVAAQADYNDED